jgi:DNA replication protein DnaC
MLNKLNLPEAPYSTTVEQFSEEELVRNINARHGKERREGYDCPICHNKEFVLVLKNGVRHSYACKCVRIRQTITRLRVRGLLELYRNATFDKYIVTEEWQKQAKELALAFQKSSLESWFFIAGQSGCGKTHLCTAIAGKLILSGHDVQIFRWVEWAAKAKSAITDSAEYERLIQPLKECEILYLDDFLKVQRGQTPTAADIRLAFEVLDARYNSPGKSVILSSEFNLRQIADFDEALASRIAQRSGKFSVQIQNASGRNYRIKTF